MKRIVLLALLLPVTALAQNLITTSRHNLASGGSGTGGVKGTSTQICIYCHTPHNATTTQLLWNHRSSTLTYAWATNTTTVGTALPTTQAGMGESGRCLSCHDASMGVGDVWNAGGGVTGTVGAGTITNAVYQMGASGDMSGNHPVAVPWPGTGASGITSGQTTRLSFYRTVTTSGCTSPSGICTSNNTEVNIKGTLAAPMVQCVSCHEPHGVAGNSYFLRVSLNNSTLCQACHNK